MRVRPATPAELAEYELCSSDALVNARGVTLDGDEVEYVAVDDDADGEWAVVVCYFSGATSMYEYEYVHLPLLSRRQGEVVMGALSRCLTIYALELLGFKDGL